MTPHLPLLSELVLLLCKLPATEADCERVFSREKWLHDASANQLDPRNVEKQVFIFKNFPLFMRTHPEIKIPRDEEEQPDVEEIPYPETQDEIAPPHQLHLA